MARKWVIAPHEHTDRESYEKAWNYDSKHNVIAVGWGHMGDLNGLSQTDIEARHKEAYPCNSKHNLSQILDFWLKIEPGDLVVARAGRSKLVGVGTVTGCPYYDQERGLDRLPAKYDEWHFLPVQWRELHKKFDEIVFPIRTICQLHDKRVLNWLASIRV